MQLGHCIRIHVREQPREDLQDRDAGACPHVNVAEFERNHGASHKYDSFRQRVSLNT
jgi:hypothetical protein